MGAALLVCRLALAAVFAIAGVAKLADLAGARRAAAELGVPQRVAALVGTALPIAELALAAALIPPATARYAAIASAILLATFTVALARSDAADCHCFGQLHGAAAGPRAIARNILLMVVAGYIAHCPVPWLAASAAALLAAAEGTVILRLRRRISELETGAPAPALGLPVGTPAPRFELETLDGRSHALLSDTDPHLLVFVDARCAPCDALMPALAQWQQQLNLTVVASGDPGRNRAKASEHGVSKVVLQSEREVTEAYRLPGTPAAVLITDGRIAAPAAAGAQAIHELAQRLVVPRAPEPGDPPPELLLASVDGTPISLADLSRERTLLIFWSPACPYSQKLLPGLRTLEHDPLPGAPAIVLISEAPPDEHAGAPVLLDPERRAIAAFGVRGTPSAVLLDEGVVASPVVTGPAPVFDLLETAALAT